MGHLAIRRFYIGDTDTTYQLGDEVDTSDWTDLEILRAIGKGWITSEAVRTGGGFPADLISLPGAPHGCCVGLGTGGKGYMFLGTRAPNPSTAPYLIRVDPDDLSTEVIQFTGHAGASAESVVYDERYLYDNDYVYAILSSTSRVKIAKIHINSMEWELIIDDDDYPSSSNASLGPSICVTDPWDHEHLYVVTYTSPTKVLKYDLLTNERVGAVDITGRNLAHSCVLDWYHPQIIVGGGSSPGWVARVHQDTLAITEAATFPNSLPGVTDDIICHTNTYCYLGPEDASAGGKIIRFKTTDLTTVRVIETGITGESCWGVFSYGPTSPIYCAFSGGSIAIIDPSTLAVDILKGYSGVNEILFPTFGGSEVFFTAFGLAKLGRLNAFFIGQGGRSVYAKIGNLKASVNEGTNKLTLTVTYANGTEKTVQLDLA